MQETHLEYTCTLAERIDAGHTVSDVAKDLGLSRSAVHFWHDDGRLVLLTEDDGKWFYSLIGKFRRGSGPDTEFLN